MTDCENLEWILLCVGNQNSWTEGIFRNRWTVTTITINHTIRSVKKFTITDDGNGAICGYLNTFLYFSFNSFRCYECIFILNGFFVVVVVVDYIADGMRKFRPRNVLSNVRAKIATQLFVSIFCNAHHNWYGAYDCCSCNTGKLHFE